MKINQPLLIIKYFNAFKIPSFYYYYYFVILAPLIICMHLSYYHVTRSHISSDKWVLRLSYSKFVVRENSFSPATHVS